MIDPSKSETQQARYPTIRRGWLCALRIFAAALLAVSIAPAGAGEFQWTPVEGILDFGIKPLYGAMGVEHPDNRPGERRTAAAWTDHTGNFWIFSGNGAADLWRYNPATGHWTWMNGPPPGDSLLARGVYGIKGWAQPGNHPGAREDAAAWVGADGALWLFGGLGRDSASTSNDYLNDLWKYDLANGIWTWVSGSSTAGESAVFGGFGTPPANVVPGASSGLATWADDAGVLWMFGNGNRLWRFDPATGFWSMMGQGASTGVYGQLGVAASGNWPGSRTNGASWIDDEGMLWLFGGHGQATGGGTGSLNDLWKYDPVSRYWAWMKGSNAISAPSVVGVTGTPDPANTPGGRSDAVAWSDSSGNLWLFGGQRALPELNRVRSLGDLWKYDPATGNWTFMKGYPGDFAPTHYGSLGVAEEENTPGSRFGAVSWTDTSGIFWLCGGTDRLSASDLWRYDPADGLWTWMDGPNTYKQEGIFGVQGIAGEDNRPPGRDAAAAWIDRAGAFWVFGGFLESPLVAGEFHGDLWKYEPLAGTWTWMGGGQSPNQYGNYGTRGFAAAANVPGARQRAATWTDSAGGLWMFGGHGYAGPGDNGAMLTDLWKYDTNTNYWMWVHGSSFANQKGVYGTKGVSAPANMPGSRFDAAKWIDATGNVWIYGGDGRDKDNVRGDMGDLWKYNPASNQWTWVQGSNVPLPAAVHGMQGTPATANTPGARKNAATWVDREGNLWLFGGRRGSDPYNDLWRYNPATGMWTWMQGPNTPDSPPVFGQIGVAAPANSPGARFESAAWTDPNGLFWLLGGVEDFFTVGGGNDLWNYNPATGMWTWVKGSRAPNAFGVFERIGYPAPANTPGARRLPGIASDGVGTVWLFGGDGYDCTGYVSQMGDLWRGGDVSQSAVSRWGAYR